MPAALIKYKALKLLVQNTGADMRLLTQHLDELNQLELDTIELSKSLLSSDADEKAFRLQSRIDEFADLREKLQIIGSPFTPAVDAEMYAFDRLRNNVEVLDLHGNTGNKNAETKQADSHLNIRVNSRDKAGWVKKAQHEGLKLSEWVVQKLNSK